MTEQELRERWPLAFNDFRRPLKIEIHKDMGLPDRSDTMRWWVRHPQYLRNLIAGGQRIDLDGNPAGMVSQDEQAVAWETLQWRRIDIARAKESRKNPSEYQHPIIGVPLKDQQREMALRMPRRGRSK